MALGLSQNCSCHSRVIQLPLSNRTLHSTPVDKQFRGFGPHFVKPVNTALLMLLQCLVLPSAPPHSLVIKVLIESLHCRPIERLKLGDPPTYRGAVVLRQLYHRHRHAAGHWPTPHSLPHPL